jgi:hypothetical protein
VICRHDLSFDGVAGRTMKFFRHADETAALGAVCTVLEAGDRKGGCSEPLGRIARGTRYGSVRHLQRLKAYKDTPPVFKPQPDRVDATSKRAATRLCKAGVTVTPADIAGLYAAASDACQVCRASNTGFRQQMLCVDHDNRSRQLRGILCKGCNSGMRLLDLDPAYYGRALWLFRDVTGIRSEPWYVSPPWYRDS